MPRYIALHDRRLRGSVSRRRHLLIVNTDAGISLVNAFRAIRADATVSKVHTLFILCHGYAGIDRKARVSVDAGGMGLQLGREDLTHQNVSMWAAIRGKVENIVIYACAAADTEPNNEGTKGDGRYLMGALAIHTDANVFAADKIQWYGTRRGLATGRFDFGDWEGSLFQFVPSGGRPSPVAGAPVELSEVMSGPAI